MAKKDKSYIIFWIIIAVIALVFLSQFIFKSGSSDNNRPYAVQDPVMLEGMDSFAQCLTEQGAVFYGTEWCGYCSQQKTLFGDSLRYVNYVDCDENKERCMTAGVEGYPTWNINGQNRPGVQQLSTLASATGCELA